MPAVSNSLAYLPTIARRVENLSRQDDELDGDATRASLEGEVQNDGNGTGKMTAAAGKMMTKTGADPCGVVGGSAEVVWSCWHRQIRAYLN